jgi:hypothetical protein
LIVKPNVKKEPYVIFSKKSAIKFKQTEIMLKLKLFGLK